MSEAERLQDSFNKVHLQWFADPSGDSGGEGGQQPAGKPETGDSAAGKPDTSEGQDGSSGTVITEGSSTQDVKLPPWSEQLEKSLRNDEALREEILGIKDPNDLFKRYLELKKGDQKAADEPDSAASSTPEIPESAEGYGLTEIEGLDVSWVGQLAANAKMSKEQAASIADGYANTIKSMVEAELENGKKAVETALTQAREEFGADWEKAVGTASRMVKEIGGEEFVDFLNNARLDGVKAGDHPDLVLGLARLAKRIEQKVGQDVFEGNDMAIVGSRPKSKKGYLTFPNTPGMDGKS